MYFIGVRHYCPPCILGAPTQRLHTTGSVCDPPSMVSFDLTVHSKFSVAETLCFGVRQLHLLLDLASCYFSEGRFSKISAQQKEAPSCLCCMLNWMLTKISISLPVDLLVHPPENKSFLPVCILGIYSLSKPVPVASINHEAVAMLSLEQTVIQKFIYTIDGGSNPLQLM